MRLIDPTRERSVWCALLLICAATSAWAGEPSMQTKLAAALAGTDRIEIYSTAIFIGPKGEVLENKPLAVFSGDSVGQEFLRVWTADDRTSDWGCMCEGGVCVDFYHGSKKLQRLRYFHGIAFQIEDGALAGTAWIKPADREKVLDWLNQHGAAPLKLRVEEEQIEPLELTAAAPPVAAVTKPRP